jgi:uncharacterized membrane protein
MAADRTDHPFAAGLIAMSTRARRIGIAILICFVIAILIGVPLYAPPDSQERSESAQFIGRFHPLVVHLPIALLLLVPLLELAGFTKRWSHLRASAGFVMYLATFAVAASVTLGWILARSGGYEGPLVIRHMWGGALLAIACILCCLLRSSNAKIYGLALCVALLLMVWTSDQGSKITHGEKYLTEFMPTPLRALLGVPPRQKDNPAAPGPANGLSPTSASSSSSKQVSAALETFFTARVEPILKNKCVTCHGANKHKANLRMDSFVQLMRGSKHGPVIKAGDPQHSELYRRVTLPAEDKHAMPAEGKPRLTSDEVKVIELWLSPGASNTTQVAAISGVPPPPSKAKRALPLAPDYRPRLETIAALEASLGIRLVPRSQNPTDGLIVRTVSFPEKCNDQTLAGLEPVADLIVDAELARTKVDDNGLGSLSYFVNLRVLDLSHTAVTTQGLQKLSVLQKLESLNLTETEVGDDGIAIPNKPVQQQSFELTSCSLRPPGCPKGSPTLPWDMSHKKSGTYAATDRLRAG